MDEVERLKNAGNAHYQAGDSANAIRKFTEALALDGQSHILFSNRAAALTMAGDYEAAIADADSCTYLRPGFAKGYSRKMQALLALGRPAEAVAVAADADAANAALEDASKMDLRVVGTLKRDARLQLLRRAMRGQWKGEVSAKMGGYSQHFNFVDDNTVVTTVLGKTLSANYSVSIPDDDGPLLLDLFVSAGGAELGEPPSVPYIVALKLLREGDTLEEYRGLGHVPQREGGRLELCCPYLSCTRPTTFDGEGYCMMSATDGEKPYGKLIDADVAELPFSQQLYRYFEEIWRLKVGRPITEAQITDCDEIAAEKIMRLMRAQNEVYELSRRFPDKAIEYADVMLRALGDDNHSEDRLAQMSLADLDESSIRRARQLLETLPEEVKDAADRARDKFFASGLFRTQLLPDVLPEELLTAPPKTAGAGSDETVSTTAGGSGSARSVDVTPQPVPEKSWWKRMAPKSTAQWVGVTAAVTATAAAAAAVVWVLKRSRKN
eukprot:Polyplicarium_translucidae@DN793_c0_g1_i1.p1